MSPASNSGRARLRMVTPPPERGNGASLDGGLEVITAAFAEQIGADTALLLACDREEQAIRARVALGLDAEVEDAAIHPGAPTGHLLKGGPAGTYSLHSVADDPIARAVNGVPIRHAVGAPMRSHAGVAGVLCAGFSRSELAHRELLVWTAETYASVAALCLEGGAGFFPALLEAASRDALTGCLNYGSLRVATEREIQRSERHGHELTCCFVDIDGFKRVNDTRGHAFGNWVLAAVASVLCAQLRNSDLVGRYGGDEFVLVLPETGPAEARSLANRLRAEVSHGLVPAPGMPLDVSVGVTNWAPGLTADDLMDRADQALAIAKEKGRGIASLPATHLGRPIARIPPSARNGHVGALDRLLGKVLEGFRSSGRPTD
jgi:diguanylate cyclase (GGDEF)-like protein